jgi:hypothetical protein
VLQLSGDSAVDLKGAADLGVLPDANAQPGASSALPDISSAPLGVETSKVGVVVVGPPKHRNESLQFLCSVSVVKAAAARAPVRIPRVWIIFFFFFFLNLFFLPFVLKDSCLVSQGVSWSSHAGCRTGSIVRNFDFCRMISHSVCIGAPNIMISYAVPVSFPLCCSCLVTPLST